MSQTIAIRGFIAVMAVILSLAAASSVRAQDVPPAPATEAPPLKQEELDQMLAPLALYPDSLLTQILMASTYPMEIVQADRWVKAHPDLKGEALTKELEAKTWDASVLSLINFPEVLASLSDELEWTIKIGDAFIADQKRVLDTIQKLRGKALENKNLESNAQQTVTVQAAATSTQIIVIESTKPDVVYVPAYDPVVVYGSWWYPSYPPPVYYTPPYYRPGAVVSFGMGFACGAAWGYAWGHSDWHGGDIDIDIDRNIEFNQNIDRSKYNRETNRSNTGLKDGKGGWQHDPSHRKGTSYRDQATANRYGTASNRATAQARDSYRGRADAGRQGLSSIDSRDAGARSRTSAGVQDRSSTGDRTNAFEGSRQSGNSTRAESQRGQSSRSSSPAYQNNRSSTGGARQSGGGSRGGGGNRGGGGGRR